MPSFSPISARPISALPKRVVEVVAGRIFALVGYGGGLVGPARGLAGITNEQPDMDERHVAR